MPELPEVETFRRFFEKKVLDKKVKAIEIRDMGILVEESQKPTLEEKIAGNTFSSTHRHGKFLFIQMDTEPWFLIHFVLSGYFRFENTYNSYHKHDRVIFHLKAGSYLAFNCMRKFGKIENIASPPDYIEDHNLGLDALEISVNNFIEVLSGRNRSIKSALLAQNIIAGVGNLYADEVLFQTKIHPTVPCQKLTKKELTAMHSNMQRILKTAIDFKADYGKFPENYFIHHRKKEGICPRCDAPLQSLKITQRTTYFCPECQTKQEK